MIKKFDKFPNHTNFELEDKVILSSYFSLESLCLIKNFYSIWNSWMPGMKNGELSERLYHQHLPQAQKKVFFNNFQSLKFGFLIGKLKGMFDHMGKVADSMIECFNQKAKQVSHIYSFTFNPNM